MYGTRGKKKLQSAKEELAKNSQNIAVANVNKQSGKERKISSKAKVGENVSSSIIVDPLPTKRKVSNKTGPREANKRQKLVELDQSDPSSSKQNRCGKKSVSKSRPKSRNVQATFTEVQQVIQMAVQADEEHLFETESSADESDNESNISEVERLPPEQASQSQCDSEIEDGQIEHNEVPQQSASHSHDNAAASTAKEQMDLLDEEMQQRILDLHDRMEESGLHGAANLIEKLFDEKPGDDKPAKVKIKADIRKAKRSNENNGRNTNSNRSIAPPNLDEQLNVFRNQSEENSLHKSSGKTRQFFVGG